MSDRKKIDPKKTRGAFLERWGLSALKLKLPFVDAEFNPCDSDRASAWELYVELLTRVTTQSLPVEHGDEKAALDSIFAIFPLTREILRKHGPSNEFAKLAIPVLNQIIRPFTAKWHKLSLAGAFKEAAKCKKFRTELAILQPQLRRYTQALAELANVEDLTGLEAN
jgi:hypothetical protein